MNCIQLVWVVTEIAAVPAWQLQAATNGAVLYKVAAMTYHSYKHWMTSGLACHYMLVHVKNRL